jgi:hypothetical protein
MKGDLEMKVSDAIFGNPKKKIDKRKDNDQKIQ